MNQLKEIFIKYGFSESEAIDFCNCFELKHIKSGKLFVQDNIRADYLGFVETGMFQFYYNKDGDEKTTYLALKNEFILSVQSFFSLQPSRENIKALVDSQVWVIKRSQFFAIQNQVSGFKDFYIKMLEQFLVCIDDSRFNYIALSPEERYARLLSEEPDLIKFIPLKYLSSLIGITPRHLSRIRNSIRMHK